MKLWDKGTSIDDKIMNFTVGNDREIDVHIAKFDLQATRAHVKMLHKIGIINDTEIESLLPELDILEEQTQKPDFFIESEYEDIHSKIEAELTLVLGDTGKKVHTARSRNDQVLVALQLYFKESLQGIKARTVSLFETLMHLAETHQDKLLPGYTHLQVAMPSSFGIWLSAYAELLIDDLILLNATQQIVDQNPLGSAAGYGSSFPIDREFTTKEMGFATLKYNVVAAQMSRGKSERTVASTLGSLANTLSRFAMDICLYMSQNFGFVSFPEELTTGSSIMPHKKNPDVFELIRGKCNKIQALSTEMVLITNNLPSGYHRDYQLLKENTIDAIETIKDILEIFDYSIAQIQIKEINLQDDKYKYLFTVDSINDLVMQGKSFREAYQIIGGQVQDGSYTPEAGKKHTHIGSINNPGFKEIREKMENLIL